MDIKTEKVITSHLMEELIGIILEKIETCRKQKDTQGPYKYTLVNLIIILFMLYFNIDDCGIKAGSSMGNKTTTNDNLSVIAV